MEQDNIEISDNQNLGQDVQETVESVEKEPVEQTSEDTTSGDESETSGTDDHPSEESKETYTKADVDRIVQERLARDRRKLQRELRGGNPNYGFQPQQAQQPYQQNVSQQQPFNQQQLTQQQLAQMTPEQQAEHYLQGLIDQKVSEKLQGQKMQEAQAERSNFFAQVQKEAAKDEDFDDFVNYEFENIARQLMPQQIHGLQSLVDLTQRLNDPKVLFEIHKQNPEEFRNLINMPRELQAAKLGEHRARAALNPRKVMSSARTPISDLPPKTSSHQTIDPTNLVVTNRVALERAKRAK